MSDVVERLAKRWHSPLTGRGYGGRDGHAEARWWMNAIAEELVATGHPCHDVAADWLRTQATKEGEDGHTQED